MKLFIVVLHNVPDGRNGKQPDGSAKTGEVKLCTIWSADRR